MQLQDVDVQEIEEIKVELEVEGEVEAEMECADADGGEECGLYRCKTHQQIRRQNSKKSF